MEDTKKKNIKFSIITPTYNRISLLKIAIASVLKQTYTKWEMLIIDDSTDNITTHWLKQLKDPRIRTFKNIKNMGANYSRNYGLKKARGDFVVFLDDDDKFTYNTLEIALQVINKNKNINWFISNRFNLSGKITKIKVYNITYDYLNDYLFGTNISGDVTHFIKRDCINGIFFPENVRNGSEWKFFAELSKNVIYAFDHNSTKSGYLEKGLTNTLNNSKFKRKDIYDKMVFLWRHRFYGKMFKYFLYYLYLCIKGIFRKVIYDKHF